MSDATNLDPALMQDLPEEQPREIGKRLRAARVALELSPAVLARDLHLSEDEYLKHERGEVANTFGFLLRAAQRLGVDISSLATGHTPKLSSYSLTRAEHGTPIKRRTQLDYFHLASQMKGRIVEPLYVKAPFVSDDGPIPLSTHAGQEFDYVLKGKLRVRIGGKEEILNEGDSLYYNSSIPHGLTAAGGEECTFLAMVIKTDAAEDADDVPAVSTEAVERTDRELIYKKFMSETVDENGLLKAVEFHYPDNFNFAYDVIDELARRSPLKRALYWLSSTHEKKVFTFRDISEYSSRAANYFTSLGIRKGDKVLLIMRRHYQYWFVINALHKIGAVAIPATNQLLPHDIEYRLQSSGAKMAVCTAHGDVAKNVDEAQKTSPSLTTKIIVDGHRDGWRSFDDEIELFSSKFERVKDLKANDPMLMYFSSGTNGYPKMVVHSFRYPLGHIVTARWWQNVDPDGLHLTISDTGWAKAGWGKIYGQWLCETCLFVYDFDRFDAADILPLFKEHGITTFCAPPTMYRFFIREDLSKYDFSTLKHVATAGEALNPEVFNLFYQATGLKIMEGFGQTETTPLLANLVGTTPKPGSMGKPTPQYEIALLGSDGLPVKTGDEGEICVKAERRNGPCGLFLEYGNDEEKNAESWIDGYYHTGDVAWCDEDGYYWYVGRIDDVIKSSGYRIGPFEVESVMMELPYVLECAVTGAPDPIRGQVIQATIVLTRGVEGSEELKKEIQNYVKTHTAPYKYPRIVKFVDALPKTPSGKIRRRALREESFRAAREAAEKK